MKSKLIKAENLIKDLSNEKVRWGEEQERLKVK